MLERGFLQAFTKERRQFAVDLLDLARASYRWRDDDNIYLGRIETEERRAVDAGRKRLTDRQSKPLSEALLLREQAMREMLTVYHRKLQEMETLKRKTDPGLRMNLKARQLTGQPAGPGIATGKARVIEPGNLFDFKAGEVLVCDAIEPEMTFIVPLAAAIVERRGGMLIHGAIIAREYGLPCVTGVPDAVRLIRTGDSVTVDGYLGIVVL